MTKAKALFLTAIVSISFSYGQKGESQLEYEVGKPYKEIKAERKRYYTHNGNILSFKVTKKHLYLLKVNGTTMQNVQKTEIELPKDATLEEFSRIGGTFYAFYSIYDKASESEQLFCRQVDFETLAWSGNEKKLVSTNGKLSEAKNQISYPATGMAKDYGFVTVPKFDLYYSADSSMFLVQYRMVPDYKNDAKSFDEIGLHMFNSELEEKWSEVVRMPYTEKKMNNLDYTVDGNGTAYVLASVYDDNTTRSKKRGSDEPNYHLELLSKSENKKLHSAEIELDGKFINGGWLYENPAHEMIYAGFYNTEGDQSAEGIFVNRFNENGEIKEQSEYTIPLEIINQYTSKRTQKRNEKKDEEGEAGFNHLQLSDMVFLEDGSIILIGEQYYTVTHTHSSTNGSYSTTSSFYNDILMSKIDPSGELVWMSKLPKRQKGGIGQGGLSYAHFYSNDKHYLFYIDNLRNRNLKPDEVPAAHYDNTSGYLTAYIVDDSSGDVEKRPFLIWKE